MVWRRRSFELALLFWFAPLAASGLSCSSADLTLPKASPTVEEDRRRSPDEADTRAGDPNREAAGTRADAAPGTLDRAPSDTRGRTTEAASAGERVRILVEPSDHGNQLVDALRGARRSIHMTMYLLSSDAVIRALSDQKRAGRDVRVVLNRQFPEGGNPNDEAFRRLEDAGVDVVWAPSSFAHTHAKSVILDGESVWIMTMNATFTSPTKNREFLAVDEDPDDVAEAEAIFDADRTNTAAPNPKRLVVSPLNAEETLLGLVAGATRSLDIEAETLADPSMVDAVVEAHGRGVRVRVVLSTRFVSPGERRAIERLRAADVELRSLSEPYVHAKAMVVDGARAYVGSINFTRTSLRQNRELGIVVRAPSEVLRVGRTIASDFAVGTAL